MLFSAIFSRVLPHLVLGGLAFCFTVVYKHVANKRRSFSQLKTTVVPPPPRPVAGFWGSSMTHAGPGRAGIGQGSSHWSLICAISPATMSWPWCALQDLPGVHQATSNCFPNSCWLLTTYRTPSEPQWLEFTSRILAHDFPWLYTLPGGSQVTTITLYIQHAHLFR